MRAFISSLHFLNYRHIPMEQLLDTSTQILAPKQRPAQKAIERNLRILAYYQIGGGILGYVVICMALTNLGFSPRVIITAIAASLFYGFSIYCGWLLHTKHNQRGLQLSLINQILQVFSFHIGGYGLGLVSGISIAVTLDITSNADINLSASLSQLAFNFNSGNEAILGLNLVALLVIVYINRLQHGIAKEDQITAELLAQRQKSISK